MSYQLIHEVFPAYLYFKTTGTIDSLDEWKQQILDINGIRMESGISKLMVDEIGLTIPSSMMAHIDLVKFILGEESISMKGLRVAVLSSKENLAANLFGELFGSNRGLTVKMFENRDDAEKWLLS